MNEQLPSKPTLRIREALNDLLQRNAHTHGKEVGEMYLGSDVFVVRLRRPQVVEGQWVNLDRTVDLFDLMDDHRQGEDE
jgi:hypothetical protein